MSISPEGQNEDFVIYYERSSNSSVTKEEKIKEDDTRRDELILIDVKMGSLRWKCAATQEF